MREHETAAEGARPPSPGACERAAIRDERDPALLKVGTTANALDQPRGDWTPWN